MLNNDKAKYLKQAIINNIDYLIIGMVCSFAFIAIYGVRILNPLYTDWLMYGGDLSQHYLGWKAYRVSEWNFPIGMLNTIAYPNKTSVIFTDSIPLLSVFFKMLSHYLPQKFQFFGVWGIVCFILQGVFAARIINQYTKNRVAVILSSIMFSFSPIMIWRMYGHTALAGHWIILFAIEPLFAYEKYKKKGSICRHAVVVGVLSSMVHIYFVPICGIIMLGICIEDALNNRTIKRAFIVLLLYLVTVITSIWILGGFNSRMDTSEGGLEGYSFNLNGLINPQGWSCILKDLPLYNDSQYEGFAYLGFGCMVIIFVSFIMFIIKNDIKKAFTNRKKEVISLIIIFIISLVLACSPEITINNSILFVIKFPDTIIDLWSIFRSTGRFIWIIVYLLMICSTIVICKFTNKSMGIILLTVVVFLQIYDIHNIILEKNSIFSEKQTFTSDIKNDEFWKAIASDSEIKHIVYCSGDGINSLTDWALENGLTVNSFYFARSMDDLIEKSRTEALDKLSREDIFIIKKHHKEECLNYNLHYYEVNSVKEVDGLIVGVSKEIQGFKELPKDYFLE